MIEREKPGCIFNHTKQLKAVRCCLYQVGRVAVSPS
jgi:hypothetical protein